MKADNGLPGQGMYVFWSHGKESGPRGTKIDALVEVARKMGFEVESLDYRGMDNPEDRVEKLVGRCRSISQPVILAGSSMGSYVATVAACRIETIGLFLLAPALYLPGFQEQEYEPTASWITVVHGWRDEAIPPEVSIRFARKHRAALHIIDGDHRLRENIPELEEYFSAFLKNIIEHHHRRELE